MLEQVSWSSYLTFILFLSLLYYGWLYLKFYRPYQQQDPASRNINFSGLQRREGSEMNVTDHKNYQPGFLQSSNAPLIYTDLLNEIDAFMEQVSGTGMSRVDFIDKLKVIAGKHGKIEEPGDRILLVEVIQQKGRSVCSFDLSEEEVVRVLNGT